MRPGVDVYLGELKRALAQDFAPRLPTSFEQSGLGRHAMLIGVVAEEFDRAASRRIEENRALRRLFADAVKVIPNLDLRSRLLAACERLPISLQSIAVYIANDCK